MKKRAKAIEAFQNDPPTTVFLLSVRSGAVGITLTAASIVYMMEPCLNPALEEQAIGRVHRMGQTRPVTVKRLWIEDSIEERITKVVNARCRHGSGAAPPEPTVVSQRGKAGEIAGAIRTDKQQLKLQEWAFLFGAASTLST